MKLTCTLLLTFVALCAARGKVKLNGDGAVDRRPPTSWNGEQEAGDSRTDQGQGIKGGFLMLRLGDGINLEGMGGGDEAGDKATDEASVGTSNGGLMISRMNGAGDIDLTSIMSGMVEEGGMVSNDDTDDKNDGFGRYYESFKGGRNYFGYGIGPRQFGGPGVISGGIRRIGFGGPLGRGLGIGGIGPAITGGYRGPSVRYGRLGHRHLALPFGPRIFGLRPNFVGYNNRFGAPWNLGLGSQRYTGLNRFTGGYRGVTGPYGRYFGGIGSVFGSRPTTGYGYRFGHRGFGYGLGSRKLSQYGKY